MALPKKNTGTTKVKAAGKTKSGGYKKKVSAYNKWIQGELARLKRDDPNMPHTERFKMAAGNWKHAKENPKAV